MSVRRPPFMLGFLLGFFAITILPVVGASDGRAEAGISVEALAEASWPHLSGDQRMVVDVVARDIYEMELSPPQRIRIGNGRDVRFEDLPEWRKTPFRGIALRQLGHGVPSEIRNAI